MKSYNSIKTAILLSILIIGLNWSSNVSAQINLAADSLIIKGRQNVEDRNFEAAIQNFDKVIGIDPKNAGAHLNLGDCYFHKKIFTQAIIEYTNAISFNSDLIDAYVRRADALSEIGDYDRAISDYDQVIRIDPQITYSYFGRGVAYRAKGDYELAIQNFTKAIKLYPEFYLAYDYRGEILAVHKNDLEGAIVDFNHALENKPNDMFALKNRAAANLKKGNIRQVLSDLERVEKLSKCQ